MRLGAQQPNLKCYAFPHPRSKLQETVERLITIAVREAVTLCTSRTFLSPAVNALCLNYQTPSTWNNCLFLTVMLPLSVLSNLPGKIYVFKNFFFFFFFFSPINLRYVRACVRACVRVCVCLCLCGGAGGGGGGCACAQS